MTARPPRVASHGQAESRRLLASAMRDATPGTRSRGMEDATASASAAVGSALWSAVRRAARDACEEARTGGELRHGDVAACFDALTDAIRQAAAGRDPGLADLPPTIPARRMLDHLRGALLEEVRPLRDSLGTGELIHLLTAFEKVGAALDRDAAHRFAGKLAGPDGLELIVEVAHDLRSPLASILFLAETLRKGQSGTLNAVQERQLGLVYSAAFGLSALASDVIELARGGDRLIDLHPVAFSVSGIMQAMHDIVRPMAEEKGLGVVLTVPDADFRIGHPSALNRVLLNLTTNALKFTAEGRVEVTAREVTRTSVEFSVHDTGRGIPPEVMATLFETFRRRVKPGDYMFSSAGLGLSICRKLVAAMGGELRVRSAPDFGTRFHFILDLPLASRL